MKKMLLALSIVANAALVFVYANRSSHWIDFSPSSPAPAPVAASPAPRMATADPDSPDPETWNDLTSGELSATAARLQAAGYPVALQRAIIGALISERFAERRKALAAMIDAHPWWRGNLFGSVSGAKVIAARQAIQREEKEMLEQVLGPDPGISDYARAQRARQTGDLPPAKASELNRINSDYNELIMEVRSGSQNILLPEDREKLAYLEKEKRADVVKLLSPDELLEYDMRSSPTANQLKFQLSAFKPTEDEYRAIFKVQQAFDAKYGPPETMTAEQRRDRFSQTTQAQLADQIKAVLPADRFADYQLKTDQAYIQANQLVTRLQLPATATAEIVAVQKDITKRADAVRSDSSLTPEQRSLQLTTLAGEATARLTPTLGVDGLTAYKQTGGLWLNALNRPPAAPAARKP